MQDASKKYQQKQLSSIYTDLSRLFTENMTSLNTGIAVSTVYLTCGRFIFQYIYLGLSNFQLHQLLFYHLQIQRGEHISNSSRFSRVGGGQRSFRGRRQRDKRQVGAESDLYCTVLYCTVLYCTVVYRSGRRATCWTTSSPTRSTSTKLRQSVLASHNVCQDSSVRDSVEEHE